MVHFKLSPNEEARILKEEREKRRKLRIKQVREQDRRNAAKIRQSVKDRKDELVADFVKDLEKKWDLERDEKLRQLESVYEQNLEDFGRSHRKAISEDPEWKEECRKAAELEERSRAEERHQLALNRQRHETEERQNEERKHIISRMMVLDLERCRSQKIASLPKPKPDPFDNIEPLKTRPVRFTDHDAFLTSRYHMPGAIVEKENDSSEVNAKLLAETEDDKYKYFEKEKKKIQNERAEKARLRHKNAVTKELLKHDYNRLMHDLDDLQRVDVNRRRQELEKLPKQIFLAPHRRLEEKEEMQMNMERAFEDMYMAATDYGGDLSLALDQKPPPHERTQSLDVTTEEHTLETKETSSSKDGTYTKEVMDGEHRDILPLQGSFSRRQVHHYPEAFTDPKQSHLAPVGKLFNADGGRQAKLLQKLRERIEAQRNQVNKNLVHETSAAANEGSHHDIGTTILPNGDLFNAPLFVENLHKPNEHHSEEQLSLNDASSLESQLSYVTPSPAGSLLISDLSPVGFAVPVKQRIAPPHSKSGSLQDFPNHQFGSLNGKMNLGFAANSQNAIYSQPIGVDSYEHNRMEFQPQNKKFAINEPIVESRKDENLPTLNSHLVRMPVDSHVDPVEYRKQSLLNRYLHDNSSANDVHYIESFDSRNTSHSQTRPLSVSNDQVVCSRQSPSNPIAINQDTDHSDTSQVSSTAGSYSKNTNNNNSNVASYTKPIYYASKHEDQQMMSVILESEKLSEKDFSQSSNSIYSAADSESQSVHNCHLEKFNESDNSSESKARKSFCHDIMETKHDTMETRQHSPQPYLDAYHQQLNDGPRLVDQTLEFLSDESFCDQTLTEDFEKEITILGGRTPLNLHSVNDEVTKQTDVSLSAFPGDKSLTTLTLVQRNKSLDSSSQSRLHYQPDQFDGSESTRAGLITFAGSVYREWWPLNQDQSLGTFSSGRSILLGEIQQKRKPTESKSSESNIQEIDARHSDDRNLFKMPTENIQTSSSSSSSEYCGFSDESVKAGYVSFQGTLPIHALHTVPSKTQFVDCSTVWKDDSMFRDLELNLRTQNKPRQFLLPSMQSTLIEEDVKEPGSLRSAVGRSSVSELSQYAISGSLNSRISSVEPSLPITVNSFSDNLDCHANSFVNALQSDCQTTKSDEQLQSAGSFPAHVCLSSRPLQSKQYPEFYNKPTPSVSTDSISRPENLDKQLLPKFIQLTGFNTFEGQVECLVAPKPGIVQQSHVEKSLDSEYTRSRWGEILETYRSREPKTVVDTYDASKYITSPVEFEKMKPCDDHSSDRLVSSENEKCDGVGEVIEELSSSCPSMIGVEDCEPGILDEPELTLVSADSTILSSRGLNSQLSSPQKIPKSMSLLSFEHHELSVTNPSPASVAEILKLKNSALPFAIGNSDLIIQDRNATSGGMHHELPLSLKESSEIPVHHSTSSVSAPLNQIDNESKNDSSKQVGISLQEAFLAKKKDFIQKSKHRVENAKENAKEKAKCSLQADKDSSARCDLTKAISDFMKTRAVGGKPASRSNNNNIGNAVEVDSKDRKLAEKEMKNRTARLYSQLEEVKLKKEEEERKNFYAHNREKRKDFEKRHNQMKNKKSNR